MLDPVISVDKLSVSYPGCDVSAVAEMESSVEEGEVFGFLGPSEVIPATLKWDENGKPNLRGGTSVPQT
ncbi:hypothetical protein GCM10007147_38700 [Nocardiopsis kunsanensis]|uniref:Uncharacterized protein n=1 Tax=Nocardiopsis kunsanensis TaxID=141693 RepID=A0A919CKB8_9ACTN|nr:hypothetical protein GCM10007147_38700 [Nocardiopsis kunsanensis]